MKNLKILTSVVLVGSLLTATPTFAATTNTTTNQNNLAGIESISRSTYPTLSVGSSGYYVYLLQSRLRSLNYNIGYDGIFGSETKYAVQMFQRNYGLTDDGIVGPRTWTALGF